MSGLNKKKGRGPDLGVAEGAGEDADKRDDRPRGRSRDSRTHHLESARSSRPLQEWASASSLCAFPRWAGTRSRRACARPEGETGVAINARGPRAPISWTDLGVFRRLPPASRFRRNLRDQADLRSFTASSTVHWELCRRGMSTTRCASVGKKRICTAAAAPELGTEEDIRQGKGGVRYLPRTCPGNARRQHVGPGAVRRRAKWNRRPWRCDSLAGRLILRSVLMVDLLKVNIHFAFWPLAGALRPGGQH